MRHLTKIALLALLALPFGGVFAATPSADINITVTITGNPSIVFDDLAGHSGGTRSWSFSSALATANASSAGAITDGGGTALGSAVGFNITNNTGSSFAVDLTAAVSADGSWTHALIGATGLNKFNVQAEQGSGGFAELTTFSILNLADGANTHSSGGDISLQFTTPTSVTTVHGGAIKVTFTATLH